MRTNGLPDAIHDALWHLKQARRGLRKAGARRAAQRVNRVIETAIRTKAPQRSVHDLLQEYLEKRSA